MRDHKKYDVWVKSHNLGLIVYKELAPLFPKSEQFEATSKMKIAAHCVTINIVEGCSRNTDKDFAHFLDISLGSVQALEYCFLFSKGLSFIQAENYSRVNEKENEIKAKLINLIKKIRGNMN